jgi:diguanylate cyclase (GGDEF)-like protein/hemerythrin-like metal-binding protein
MPEDPAARDCRSGDGGGGGPPIRPPWLLEPHVQHLFNDFPIPLALLRPDGSPVAVNASFARTLGGARPEAGALERLVRATGPEWEPIALTGAPGRLPAKGRALVIEDHVLLLLSPGEPAGGPPRDLEAMRDRISQLELLVATDRLTGAWSRAHLDRVIDVELNRSSRYRQPLSVVLLDIDHFKRINDTYGHASGDIVLRELVEVVKREIRAADLLFRWGGEEFLLLAPSTPHGAARLVAEKIRGRVQQREFAVAGRVTISAGVVEALPGEAANEIFERVDAQLYAAKNGGRNRVAVEARGGSDQWATSALLQLQWSERYECGEPTIDDQHRRLFDLSNRLIGATLSGAGGTAAETALDELLDHIARHFADEEAILAARGYGRLEEHRRIHAGLLRRAAAMRREAAGQRLLLGPLVEFLANDVVARHLLSADRDYFPLFGAGEKATGGTSGVAGAVQAPGAERR